MTQVDPQDKVLPAYTALAILDIADTNDWNYAPLLDGCYSREEMKKYLLDNPDAALSLVINYNPNPAECADSIDVSMQEGQITLELEDNFYYKFEKIDSLDQLKDTAWKMLKAYYNQATNGLSQR
jgi:hypothetical protein